MKKSNELIKIIFRYLLILIFGLGNLFIFYKIFTPLTIYPLKFILSLFSNTILVDNIILFNENAIEIISACVAGAAYYLIFTLVMSTYGLTIKKRIKIILFCFFSFLILNILRILLLIFLIGTVFFNAAHLFFWYFLSTIFVVLIWIISVKIFKIKSIPVYTDIKQLAKTIKNK